MTKPRRIYTREFKMEALRLLEASGKSAAQIERELGIGDGCLGQWRRQAANGQHPFAGHGRLTPEQQKIRQLERELELTRQERDILRKALGIFSRPSR